jgi:hypothetical protein
MFPSQRVEDGLSLTQEFAPDVPKPAEGHSEEPEADEVQEEEEEHSAGEEDQPAPSNPLRD